MVENFQSLEIDRLTFKYDYIATEKDIPYK